MEFKDRLKELMDAKHLTCRELGDMLGVTFQAVSHWTTGRYKPRKRTIEQIAELFEISVEDLIGGVTVAERETTLLRNGSGYIDPTAYKALSKIEKEEGTEMKRGEIWEVEKTNREYDTVVVIAAQENACNTLLLKDEAEEGKENMKVLARHYMYTDPGLLAYKSKRKFTGFIRRMNDEEFGVLLEKVAESLGITCSADAGYAETITDMEKKLEAAEKNAVDLQRKLIKQNELREDAERQVVDLRTELGQAEKARDGLLHEVDRLNEELILQMQDIKDVVKTQVERDFYKEQYEKLFRIVTGNAVTV